MLWYKKELSCWLMWDWRNAQVFQPHSSRLTTADWRMMYFDFRSVHGFAPEVFVVE